MATPKIKIYKLLRGYSEDGDNDVQQETNDELLPVVDKPILPEDSYELKGVTYKEESLNSISSSSYNETLTVSGDKITLGNTPVVDKGFYVPYLEDLDGVISSSEYSLNSNTGEITFSVTPNGNVDVTYWTYGGTSGQTWFLTYYEAYDGSNYNYQEKVYDNGGELILSSNYTFNNYTGQIVFDTSVTSPTIKYYQKIDQATIFVSDHPNWVLGPKKQGKNTGTKLRTNPDVFVGTYDYPGDDSEDDLGNPIVQGPIPEYVDSGFQINYRDGVVTFSSEVDSFLDTVRASYAYHKQINNVTGQVLDLIDEINGYTYKADSEKEFNDSHGKRWVTRDNYLMPINFYVDGEVTPQINTIRPYMVLSTWDMISLSSGGSYDVGSGDEEEYVFYFDGSSGDTATVTVNGVDFIVANIDNKFIWAFGDSQQYVFTQIGEQITRNAGQQSFTITWSGFGSLIFVVKDFYNISLFIDDFESGNLDKWTSTNETPSIISGVSGYGNVLKLDADGERVVKILDSSVDDFYMKFDIYVQNNSECEWTCGNSLGNAARMRVSGSKFQYYNGTSWNDVGDCSPSTWYNIVLYHFDFDNNTYWILINGVNKVELEFANDSINSIDRFSHTQNNTYFSYFDNINVYDIEISSSSSSSSSSSMSSSSSSSCSSSSSSVSFSSSSISNSISSSSNSLNSSSESLSDSSSNSSNSSSESLSDSSSSSSSS